MLNAKFIQKYSLNMINKPIQLFQLLYISSICFLKHSLAVCLCSFIVLVKIPNVLKETGHNFNFFANSKPNNPYFFPCSVIYLRTDS